MSVLDALKDNYRKAKADITGKATSRARRLKGLVEIDPSARKPGVPQPTGIRTRTIDGKPMMFFTDGSVRHAFGRATTKAARKRLKQARRTRSTS